MMRVPSRRTVRVVSLVVLVGGLVLLGNSFVAATGTAASPPQIGNGSPGAADGAATDTATPSADVDIEAALDRSAGETAAVPPDAEVTVVATQGAFVSDEDGDLVAFTRDGTVVYHNSTYEAYFDVDPVAGTRYTVEYVAARRLVGDDCSEFETLWCTKNVVERVNLSTGEIERVYAKKVKGVYGSRWHDVDRLNETHLVVADIREDRVFVVDTRDGGIDWEWRASRQFDPDQGGKPGDWTHLNDVEVLADGRIMVSVRNMDQVVFLRPGEGVQESWTLGSEDERSVLFEQHNPDYLPAGQDGPAVLVADSENNRVVEYRREDGDWRRTWDWRDVRLQWPRDADRLPDGDTLIVDSHGDRVLEVSPDGEVVWSVNVGMPYDAERLGTGDESTGPALRAGGDAGDEEGAIEDPSSVPPDSRAVLVLKNLLPSILVNGLLYVAPSWFHFTDLLVAFVVLLDLFAWTALEYRWSSLSFAAVAGRILATAR